MADDHSSTIRDFLVEMCTGSLDKAISYLTEDAMWTIVQTVRGATLSKDQLKARVAGMRASFQNNLLQVKLTNFIENGASDFTYLALQVDHREMILSQAS